MYSALSIDEGALVADGREKSSAAWLSRLRIFLLSALLSLVVTGRLLRFAGLGSPSESLPSGLVSRGYEDDVGQEH